MMWKQVLTTIKADDMSVCPPELRDDIRQACDELLGVTIGQHTTSTLDTRQVFDLARRFADSADLRDEAIVWKRNIVRHYIWK